MEKWGAKEKEEFLELFSTGDHEFRDALREVLDNMHPPQSDNSWSSGESNAMGTVSVPSNLPSPDRIQTDTFKVSHSTPMPQAPYAQPQAAFGVPPPPFIPPPPGFADPPTQFPPFPPPRIFWEQLSRAPVDLEDLLVPLAR